MGMHPWDLGLLLIGGLLLLRTGRGILDAPRSQERERAALRGIRNSVFWVGGALYVGAVALAIQGARRCASFGAMVAPTDEALAWFTPIVASALAWVYALGSLGAARVVSDACRRGRARAAIAAAVPLACLGLGIWLLADPGHRAQQPEPVAALMPPPSMEACGFAVMVVLLVGGVLAISAIWRTAFGAKDAAARRLGQRRCLFAGAAVATAAVLGVHFALLSVLLMYSLLGPLGTRSLPAMIVDSLTGAPLLLAVGGLGLAALTFGLPALRGEDEAEDPGERAAEPPASSPPPPAAA